MEAPFLYKPVKQPINQGNLFGATSPMYATLSQKGHPGIDFECVAGTKVYAPCDGDAFYTTDKFGGCGLWIRVPNNVTPKFNIILWHMPPAGNQDYPYQIPTVIGHVTPVKAGQFLGYSGDSGYPLESTGPHLHLGIIPCDATGGPLNFNNGYDGCVDPIPYLNGDFAEDIGAVATAAAVVQETTQIVQDVASAPISNADKFSLLDEVKQLLSAISVLFKGRNNTS